MRLSFSFSLFAPLLGARRDANMNYVAVFTLWMVCLFAISAHSEEDWSRSRPWSSHGVDTHNATQLHEYAASLRRVLVQQSGSSSPGMTPNALAGRIRNPFEGIWLESRQSCTGGADNYCFPDPNSFCGNCGTCCTQANEGYCCGSTSVCCAPDRAIKGRELGGCCGSWQTCEQDTGCTDPT
jgi:hypothetical protein